MTFSKSKATDLAAMAREDDACLAPAELESVRDIAAADYSVLAVVLAVVARQPELASQLTAAVERVGVLEREAERLRDLNGAHAEGHWEALKMYDEEKAMKACDCQGVGHTPWCRAGLADEHAKLRTQLSTAIAERDAATLAAATHYEALGDAIADRDAARAECERLKADQDATEQQRVNAMERGNQFAVALEETRAVLADRDAQATTLAAALEEAKGRGSCPCEFLEVVEPCNPQCSCRNEVMSGGCRRCARYGSREQRLAMAKRLVAMEAVHEIARRWCTRPESVLKEGASVLANDAEMWRKLRAAVANTPPRKADDDR